MPPLQIDSAKWIGDTVQLVFVAEAGATYTVEYRDAFDAAHSWSWLEDVPAQVNTASIQVTDPNPGASGARYYRLVTPARH